MSVMTHLPMNIVMMIKVMRTMMMKHPINMVAAAIQHPQLMMMSNQHKPLNNVLVGL
ncbi:hypothetical protein PROVALCAL_02080 [Providencia alcalifaciens DSM 30120]|uniref:Uncharacterized protein n=1 Tax=Providencia alcalifaciens DSM 30120 TaxID=520999 RepID=B6XFE8_9GAMM|nr:hypothetical protein PROVALCAL_02080 [Providencia alcalifaciens DSM 30120]